MGVICSWGLFLRGLEKGRSLAFCKAVQLFSRNGERGERLGLKSERFVGGGGQRRKQTRFEESSLSLLQLASRSPSQVRKLW